MNATATKNRPTAEQLAELLKLRKEQFALRLQRATGQAVKPDQFGKVRKNIARLKTAMTATISGAVVAAKSPAKAPAKKSPATSKVQSKAKSPTKSQRTSKAGDKK